MSEINNEFYNNYGDRWYTAQDDPVALLRAESKTRNPWMISVLQEKLKSTTASGHVSGKVLDIGCGAGFLTNELARSGFEVIGLDASPDSLAVAKRYDVAKTVKYLVGDAHNLPFADSTFDVVSAMDFLEHVPSPEAVIREAARVLKPRGLFFFHTFNRNRLAWLIVIKGVEWFVKNTPKNMHVLPLFVKPQEVISACALSGMKVLEMRGCRPTIDRSFFKMLMTRTVPKEFSFKFVKSTLISYSGYAQKTDV